MPNEVQFDIDQVQRTSFKPKGSILVRLVMNYSGGLIKDERQANYILFGVAIIAFVVSMFLFRDATKTPSPLPPDQIIYVAGPDAKIGKPAK